MNLEFEHTFDHAIEMGVARCLLEWGGVFSLQSLDRFFDTFIQCLEPNLVDRLPRSERSEIGIAQQIRLDLLLRIPQSSQHRNDLLFRI